MPRATKIVATLGPASSDPDVLERLLRAGVDVVRLNFSHGKAQDHIDRANLVRQIALKVGKPVALMADLQGPKIRVGKFAEGKVFLEHGQKFVLDAARTEAQETAVAGALEGALGGIDAAEAQAIVGVGRVETAIKAAFTDAIKRVYLVGIALAALALALGLALPEVPLRKGDGPPPAE